MDIRGRLHIAGALLTGKGPAIVRENQKAAMHEATQYVSRRVKERTPQGVMGAQGGLLGSIQPEVRETKTTVIGIVGTANPYGLVVEKGRRPGKRPPPGSVLASDIASKQLIAQQEGPLLRWIEVKLEKSRDEALKIEPAIRFSMAKKGFEGKHMFEKTLDEDWPDIAAIFDRRGVSIKKGLER
ncbi:MAG: hypothetical protein HY911_04495 [Desulfobacterales bacterium]|nr:hypothetical protein [Desulfobacterales bacterium]